MRITRPLLAVLACLAGASVAQAQTQIGPTMVIDAATGDVLQSDRGGVPWLPASLTKMMTTYVALRQVSAGRVTMNSGLRVSQRAFRSAPSKMGFRPGSVVTLDNALKIIMVKSANDVSVTIAEGLGGSVENFVGMMNAEARRLGMTGTRFINPNGLPGAGQQTTARDMAVLARAMMREFPQHSILWRMPAIRFGNRVMRNPNHLIGRYLGADGFKTGFTCASGFNVVATATRGGRQLIVVVMGATSARGRSETAANLFNRHFSGFGGGGGSLQAVANQTHLSPPSIRDQACRRRGRQTYIEAGEELDNEPIASVDPGNLSYAQMMAGPGRRSSTATPFAGVQGSTPSGAFVSALGPYRPTMDPVPVFLGNAGPMAAPAAPALAAVPPAAEPAAPTAPQPGAIGRPGTATAAVPPASQQPARPGAISAPMTLQGAALPAPRPASAPPRADERPVTRSRQRSGATRAATRAEQRQRPGRAPAQRRR
ncbi:D-alanyl-D-alanine carboxypeptidase family protein [Phreatobacter sp.]|uniref:D-alanyl-D-alanine carboxypeptidase family protein n=1 Tax=Phreatobacter sp. TaxID=1966341 RepID=UPI003F6EB320